MSDKKKEQTGENKPVERLTKYIPIIIPFEQSYTLDGEKVSSVTMRPPTCGDVINSQTMAASVRHEKSLLYANLCDLTEEFVSSLSYYDAMLLEVAYSRFLFPLQTFSELLQCSLAKDLEDTIFSD